MQKCLTKGVGIGGIEGRGRLLGKLAQCTRGTCTLNKRHTQSHPLTQDTHTRTSASSGGGAQKLSGASARDLSRAKAPSMVLREGRRSTAVLVVVVVVVTLGAAALPVLPPLATAAAAFFFLAMAALVCVCKGPVERCGSVDGWVCGKIRGHTKACFRCCLSLACLPLVKKPASRLVAPAYPGM